jgi:anti-sigma B factor antagonist
VVTASWPSTAKSTQRLPRTTRLSRDILQSFAASETRVPDSNFPVTRSDGLAVVTTPDEIDINNAGLLGEALLAAAAASRPVVIVDMTGTEFCDSTGLSVLARALRQTEEAGGQLTLVVRTPGLRRMLAVSGAGSLFQIYDSLGDAVDAARAGRPAGPA